MTFMNHVLQRSNGDFIFDEIYFKVKWNMRGTLRFLENTFKLKKIK